MKKKILLLSFLIYVSLSDINAQIDSINFSDYKLPDLKRQTLDFKYNLNNYYTGTNSSTDSVINNKSTFQIINDIDIDYYRYTNTRKYQGRHTAKLSIHQSYNSNVFTPDSFSPIKSTKRNRFNNNLYLNSVNRFYFKKKYFWGLNFNTTINYYSDINNTLSDYAELKDTLTDYYRIFSASVSPELSIGKGRIEPISDYIHSIRLIKEFEKKGRLTRPLKKNELIKLTELIANLKNKRFFDSRLRTVYELEQVDSFLNANNLVTDIDIKYFTSLNDMWQYGGLQNRYQGSSISFYLKPSFIGDNSLLNNESDTISSKSSEIFLEVGINYVGYKNINLYWQRYFGFNIGASSNENILDDSINFSQLRKKFFAEVFYGYDWYPNTRTKFNFGISSGYGPIIYNSIFPEDKTYIENELYANLYLSAYYYISPKFRISLSGKGSFDFFNNSAISYNNDNYKYFFFAGIQYSLF